MLVIKYKRKQQTQQMLVIKYKRKQQTQIPKKYISTACRRWCTSTSASSGAVAAIGYWCTSGSTNVSYCWTDGTQGGSPDCARLMNGCEIM